MLQDLSREAVNVADFPHSDDLRLGKKSQVNAGHAFFRFTSDWRRGEAGLNMQPYDGSTKPNRIVEKSRGYLVL